MVVLPVTHTLSVYLSAQLLEQVTMARFTIGLDGDNRVNGG